MKTRLRHAWVTITTGYWFVPSVMTAAAVVAALVMVTLDRRVIGPGSVAGWVYSGGADGAKTLLSAVAGSVITVAGVVFSITVAALTQASSQFGPRLLRNFTRDTSNQVVLGTFVATFAYCLVVLRTVRGGDEGLFVPHTSVTVAVLLAGASIGVLIYFIHHVSATLQAPTVIAKVAAELARAIEQTPKSDRRTLATAGEASTLPADFDRHAFAVPSTRDGYVQAVDLDRLVSLAKERGVQIRLACRPGDHVIERNPLAHVGPADRSDSACESWVQGAFIVGDHPTEEQDIEYSVRQIVEVAVRALSPGVNDPFTAVNALDVLAAGVCRVARRGLPGPSHFDDAGVLRVVVPVTTFEGFVDAAFDQIRQYGRGSVAVSVRLLEVLASCASQCDVEQRTVLLRHVEMSYHEAAAATLADGDRAALRVRYEAAVQSLGGTSEPNIA